MNESNELSEAEKLAKIAAFGFDKAPDIVEISARDLFESVRS